MDEAELVRRVRERDVDALTQIVTEHHERLVRLAGTFVRSRSLAEEAAQETWLAVMSGIDRFEGRSSLKTWIFAILVNRSRSLANREARSAPADGELLDDMASRFGPSGAWSTPPEHWSDQVDDRIAAAQLLPELTTAMAGLPPRQRAVVTLRDVEGLTSEETCELLGITNGNERVLLHRGRSYLRAALETSVRR